MNLTYVMYNIAIRCLDKLLMLTISLSLSSISYQKKKIPPSLYTTKNNVYKNAAIANLRNAAIDLKVVLAAFLRSHFFFFLKKEDL